MKLHSQEKRIFLFWLLLMVLSVVSYRLIDGGEHIVWLFALCFLKLERIWKVYLELGRGPRLFQAGVLFATLALMGAFAAILY